MNASILWADDEIDLLKPHILFLQNKGYEVETVRSGRDALDSVASRPFDLIILDENMPGLTGLETLSEIKRTHPHIPVIMITKSEEEDIMNQAIGSKISDYLIKPLNPNQILLSIKKNLHSGTLVSEQTTTDYRQNFAKIGDAINSANSIDDWCSVYRDLTFWELNLASAQTNMDEIIAMQKNEANSEFSKYVKKNYYNWISTENRDLLMSPDIMKKRIFPLIDKGEKVFLIVIDNFRLDQWLVVKPLLGEFFNIESDELYCTILPTATQYARNAIFSGLMPIEIEKLFPDLWVDEEDEEGKNINEEPLIQTVIERFRKNYRFSYTKINDSSTCDRIVRELPNLDQNDLNVMVVNFIDMLSHSRTEMKMIRELASTDAAYRSLTESWFRHSSILGLFRAIAARDYKVILTTDHGTVKVDNPIKVVGDRNTNTNLRYKVGKNLSYNTKQVYEIKEPSRYGLPEPNLSSSYIFATGRNFLAYPNNYNYYVQYYADTFQHGGISLEEMLVPIVTLKGKR